MALTVDDIVNEVRTWSPEQTAKLVDSLAAALHDDQVAVQAWSSEIQRRVAEIESGSTQGISGDEVSARIRNLLAR